jgi:hypothetical protein
MWIRAFVRYVESTLRSVNNTERARFFAIRNLASHDE